jgi:hypothetical protein
MQQRLPPYQRTTTSSRGGSSNDPILLNVQTSSSFDSYDGNEQKHPPRGSRSSGPPRPRTRSSHNKDVPPPPQPPLPPPASRGPPGLHVRQDSNGSVSSLGSLERSGKEDSDGKPSLFQRLNPFAPRVALTDFHRKNQTFLSKVKRSNVNTSPSPRQIQRRYVFVRSIVS